MPQVQVIKVVSWRRHLFAIEYDGSLHRINSSFDAKQIAPAMPGGKTIAPGLCNSGIWVAGRDGQIRISSGTDLTVTVKVPTSDP